MGTLYERIKALCDEKGIKPGKMCVDTGVSKGLISDLKYGRKKSIQIETAQKIARYFGVSVDVLLGGENENAPTDDAMSAKKEPAGFDESSITKRELLNLVSDLSETEAALFLELLKNALGKS